MDQQNSVLEGEDLATAVQTLNVGWAVLPGKGLVRVFPTNSFREGFMIVAKVADLAEAQNHDPEVLFRYDEVEVSVYTHEAGGITPLDVNFASALDATLDS